MEQCAHLSNALTSASVISEVIVSHRMPHNWSRSDAQGEYRHLLDQLVPSDKAGSGTEATQFPDCHSSPRGSSNLSRTKRLESLDAGSKHDILEIRFVFRCMPCLQVAVRISTLVDQSGCLDMGILEVMLPLLTPHCGEMRVWMGTGGSRFSERTLNTEQERSQA